MGMSRTGARTAVHLGLCGLITWVYSRPTLVMNALMTISLGCFMAVRRSMLLRTTLVTRLRRGRHTAHTQGHSHHQSTQFFLVHRKSPFKAWLSMFAIVVTWCKELVGGA